jgi:hypothetical protein
MQLTDAKTGLCLLCRGAKEKEVFAVKGPSFTGDVCGPHLFILVRQAKADEAGPGRPADPH